MSDKSQGFVETQMHAQGMEAFQQMFVASRSQFVAMARAILRNKEDAEDAVQNAFLSGTLHLRSFEGRSALRTWFTRIVLNAALMIRRKQKSLGISLPPETIASDDPRWTQKTTASQPDPEVVYAEREIVEFINAALGKMKPALRQAFAMTYFDEMSGPQASALLGVSAGTFKARLFRARRQLLNHARQTLVAPIRKTTPSAFFQDKNAFHISDVRRPDRAALEALCS